MIIAVCDPKGIAIEAIKTILYHDKGLSDRISRIYEFWNMEQLLDASRDSSFDCIVFPNYCNSHNSVVCSLSCGYNRFPLVEHDPRYTLIVRDILYTPYSRMAENRIRQESNLQKSKRASVEKKIKTAQHALERFEGEILKCLDGTSNFTEDMIAKQIRRYQQELDDAKAEYAALQNARLNEAAEIRKLRTYYDEFRGWAEEFDAAPLEIKRMILSQLIERVEVGRKYQVTIKLNMEYQQFLEITEEQKLIPLISA